MDIIRIEFSLRSVITDTTDRYGPIITVGGVGGDFSHTVLTMQLSCNTSLPVLALLCPLYFFFSLINVVMVVCRPFQLLGPLVAGVVGPSTRHCTGP